MTLSHCALAAGRAGAHPSLRRGRGGGASAAPGFEGSPSRFAAPLRVKGRPPFGPPLVMSVRSPFGWG